MGEPTLLFVAFFTALLIQGGHSTTFTIKNNCRQTVWPAALTGHNSAALSQTGFELKPSASLSVAAPAKWSGRIWGRTQCSTDASRKFSCQTGDCGTGLACVNSGGKPPATLVEFTLQGADGKDFYDVSNVDGFNLPVSVVPEGGRGECGDATCPTDINKRCPQALQVKGSGGSVVACRSACLAFNTEEYCCGRTSPSACKATSYSRVFKNACPKAYSYAYDDATSAFTCVGANYLITFCP